MESPGSVLGDTQLGRQTGELGVRKCLQHAEEYRYEYYKVGSSGLGRGLDGDITDQSMLAGCVRNAGCGTTDAGFTADVDNGAVLLGLHVWYRRTNQLGGGRQVHRDDAVVFLVCEGLGTGEVVQDACDVGENIDALADLKSAKIGVPIGYGGCLGLSDSNDRT